MQPKPTSLEVLEKMEVGTTTATLDDKQQSGSEDSHKGSTPTGGSPDARSQSGKPAPERKRSRNLSEDRRFKLFSGTANRPLARAVARHIGVKVGEAKLQRFADGEVYFQLP